MPRSQAQRRLAPHRVEVLDCAAVLGALSCESVSSRRSREARGRGQGHGSPTGCRTTVFCPYRRLRIDAPRSDTRIRPAGSRT